MQDQWRWGDPWLTASYSDKATFINDKSRWAVGIIARPPMSRESQVNGQYFALGPNASFSDAVNLFVAKPGAFPKFAAFIRESKRGITAYAAGHEEAESDG